MENNNLNGQTSIDEIINSLKSENSESLDTSDKSNIDDIVNDIISNAKNPQEQIEQKPAEETPAPQEPSQDTPHKNAKTFDEVFPLKNSSKSHRLDLDELISMKQTPSYKPTEKTGTMKPHLFDDEESVDIQIPSEKKPKFLTQKDDSIKKEYLRFFRAKKKADDFMASPISEQEQAGVSEENLEENDFNSYAQAKDFYNDIFTMSKKFAQKTTLLIVLSVIALYLTLSNYISFVPLIPIFNINAGPIPFVAVSLVLLIASALIALPTVKNGLVALLKLKANRDSTVAINVVFSAICLILALISSSIFPSNILPLFLIFPVLQLLFSTLGRKLTVAKTALNFELVSSRGEKHVTTIIEDQPTVSHLSAGVHRENSVVSTNTQTNFAKNFFANSYCADSTDAISQLAVIVLGACAIILAIASYIATGNAGTTLATVGTILSFFCPLALCLCINLPLYLCAKRNAKKGMGIFGSDACYDFSSISCVCAHARDLFPEQSIEILGVKTFPGMRVDEAIVDTASVFYKTGGIFRDKFINIIAQRTELLKDASSVIYEDFRGVNAVVDGRNVLIGNKALIESHDIEIPINDFEQRFNSADQTLLYVAIEGVLTVVFVVKLNPAQSVSAALAGLDKNNVSVIVKSVDAFITRDKLCELFDKDISMFKVIPPTSYTIFDNATKATGRMDAQIINNGSFFSYAKSIITAKRLKSTTVIGIIALIASIVLGIITTALYTLTSSILELGVPALLAYHFIWLLISLAIILFNKK